ncbi:MAG: deoxyguanosinetriphosphate triphosphohydrolase, partial [Thermodesulfobacteriota bacterium]
VRSALLDMAQLAEVTIFARHMKAVLRQYPRLPPRRLRHETVRHMIDTLVSDLIRTSADNIRRHAPASIEEVRLAPPLIAFSARIRKESDELKRFLRENLYRHYRVVRMSGKARRIVTELFAALHSDNRLLPPEFQERAGEDAPRAIADYIAGMTDRYAILEHRRLFAIDEI